MSYIHREWLSIDCSGTSALKLAVYHLQPKIVDLLIKHGAKTACLADGAIKYIDMILNSARLCDIDSESLELPVSSQTIEMAKKWLDSQKTRPKNDWEYPDANKVRLAKAVEMAAIFFRVFNEKGAAIQSK